MTECEVQYILTISGDQWTTRAFLIIHPKPFSCADFLVTGTNEKKKHLLQIAEFLSKNKGTNHRKIRYQSSKNKVPVVEKLGSNRRKIRNQSSKNKVPIFRNLTLLFIFKLSPLKCFISLLNSTSLRSLRMSRT